MDYSEKITDRGSTITDLLLRLFSLEAVRNVKGLAIHQLLHHQIHLHKLLQLLLRDRPNVSGAAPRGVDRHANAILDLLFCQG